ncbi:MAG: hypothetical protein ACOC7T_06140 [Planctomycetota bacterium]
MRRIACVGLVALALFGAAASASVKQLFSAHVPLLDPQDGVVVREVIFQSRYAQPESTLQAAAWPYRVNTGPGEGEAGDLNPASLIGARIRPKLTFRPEPGGEVVLDLGELEELPPELKRRRPRLSRAEVIEALLAATRRNLRSAGIERCRLSVVGHERHEDLKELEVPSTLKAAAPTDREQDSE